MRARSTATADGLDASRALQRVLYRSAKQDPNRRFHALYDKVARSDVLASRITSTASCGPPTRSALIEAQNSIGYITL